MAEYTNTPGTASLNAALMHTLQRHRDILQVSHSLLSLLVQYATKKKKIIDDLFLDATHGCVFIYFLVLFLLSSQDYTHEFHKTKGNFLAIREREDLLGSVRKDIE